MKDYYTFPPIKYFIRVLKSCPISAILYIQLWHKRGQTMSFKVIKKDIRKEFLISPTLFRNNLTPLMYINLLSFKESDKDYEISIMGAHLND
jgi:hypothetical protein